MSLSPDQLVRQVTGTVAIAGTDRTSQVTSVSVDRDIATTLPTLAAAGGGLSKATGTVELTDPGAVVAQTRNSPWSRSAGWPPARADTAIVDVAVNDETPTRRFTGRVAAVNGSATDVTKVDIEDLTDNLKVPISHWPLLRTMPPPGDSTGAMLNVGLRADYLANVIFRKAGYTTTPPVAGVGCLSVPAQASMWPEIGTCRSCTEADGTVALPAWHPAPWGWAVSDVAATYGLTSFGNQTMRGRVLAMGMMVAPDHAGIARMDVTLGTNTLSVRVLNTRQVELRQNGNAIGTVTPAAGWTRVDVSWGETHGGARIRTDNGYTTTVAATFNAGTLDGAYAKTDITVNPNGRAAGFVVQFTPNSYTGGYAVTKLNATIVPGSLLTGMAAIPSITSRDGLDLLTEISQATVTSMWIDNDGHLWWVHPDRLRDQNPAVELTSTADLLDLAWKDTSDSARRSVTITYDQPTIRRKKQYRLTAWEGGGDNLEQGESSEEIIDPGSSTDWIDVAGLGQAIYATPAPSNPEAIPGFNRGIGSWVGGSHVNADGETPASLMEDGNTTEANAHEFPDLSRTLERIGPAAWKLTVGLEDIADNYWVSIQQSLDLVPELGGSRLNGSWNGQKMPILRCKAITDWGDASAISSITGPSGYEDFDHEAGPWIGDGATALADWIAQQVTNPSPILDGFRINYRSDIQLGMVIDIIEDAVYDIRIRALVIGMKEAHELANSTLDLTCRVISVERLSWTYDEMTRYWDIKGGDYDALTATGQTYDTTAMPPADLADVLATPLIEPLPAPIIDWPEDTEDGS